MRFVQFFDSQGTALYGFYGRNVTYNSSKSSSTPSIRIPPAATRSGEFVIVVATAVCVSSAKWSVLRWSNRLSKSASTAGSFELRSSRDENEKAPCSDSGKSEDWMPLALLRAAAGPRHVMTPDARCPGHVPSLDPGPVPLRASRDQRTVKVAGVGLVRWPRYKGRRLVAQARPVDPGKVRVRFHCRCCRTLRRVGAQQPLDQVLRLTRHDFWHVGPQNRWSRAKPASTGACSEGRLGVPRGEPSPCGSARLPYRCSRCS